MTGPVGPFQHRSKAVAGGGSLKVFMETDGADFMVVVGRTYVGVKLDQAGVDALLDFLNDYKERNK